MVEKQIGLQLLTERIFHILYSKILPGYPTTRPGNSITRLSPGHLLPGPGIAKPRAYALEISLKDFGPITPDRAKRIESILLRYFHPTYNSKHVLRSNFPPFFALEIKCPFSGP